MSGSEAVVKTMAGAGGLPKVAFEAPDGARAEVYLYGAHVASWVPAGGTERLFMSASSEFKSGVPIRGGVPVCFPQFSRLGPLPQHGLVRALPWEYAGLRSVGDTVTADFVRRDDEDTRRAWPHAFEATLSVTVGGPALTLGLTVYNPGESAFEFTAALHTYLALAGDIGDAAVEGLSGLRYRDAAAGGVEVSEQEPQVRFGGQVDRIYFSPPGPVTLHEGSRTTEITNSGFIDVVVWNPGAERGATLPDLEPGGYHRFVCIEAAAVGQPIGVDAGQRWEGRQVIR